MSSYDDKDLKNEILDMGNFAPMYIPLALKYTPEAALVLSDLLTANKHFVVVKGEFTMIQGYKAFYYTFEQIELGTGISADRLRRNRANNPLNILEKAGLIAKVKKVIPGRGTINYYILNHSNIRTACAEAAEYRLEKLKAREEAKKEKKKEIEVSHTLFENPAKPRAGSTSTKRVLLADQNGTTVEPKWYTSNKQSNNKQESKNTNLTNLCEAEVFCEDSEASSPEVKLSVENKPKIASKGKTAKGRYTSHSFISEEEKEGFKGSWKSKLMDDEDKSQRLSHALANVMLDGGEDETMVMYNALSNVLLNFEEADNFTVSSRDLDLIEDLKYNSLEQYEMIQKMIDNAVLIQIGDKPVRFGNLFVGLREMSESKDNVA